MNRLGKDWITNNLATEIKNLFSPKKINSLIILNWKEKNANDNQDKSLLQVKRNSVAVQNIKEVHLLRRSDSNNDNHINEESDHTAQLDQVAEQCTARRKKFRNRSEDILRTQDRAMEEEKNLNYVLL
jgi:hypothetical protein